jgi:hypothetical protein
MRVEQPSTVADSQRFWALDFPSVFALSVSRVRSPAIEIRFITVEDSHAHEGQVVTATPLTKESSTGEKPVAGVE